MTREQAREALSALLLGELDPERAKDVRSWVEKDGELAEELAELVDVLALSTRVLASGPEPRLRPWQRLRIRVHAFRPFGLAKSAFVLPVVVLASLLLVVRGPDAPVESVPESALPATTVVVIREPDDGVERAEAAEVAAESRSQGARGLGAHKPSLGRRGHVESSGLDPLPPAAARPPTASRSYSAPPVRRRSPPRSRPAPTRPEPPRSTAIARPPMVNYDRFLDVDEHPLSTFSTDVDTASYSRLRQSVRSGVWPGQETRIEEMINYFPYEQVEPSGAPIGVESELTRAPWDDERWLVRVSLRAARGAQVPAKNLVFLVDVSGSMDEPKKLPLLVDALTVLTRQLGRADRVSIVAYAGYSGVLLEPTSGDRKDVILRALRSLSAGGSTNGAGGILEAYRLARESRVHGGVNRVILATDGDFNVGVDSPSELEDLIAEQAGTGIYLSALGFGESSQGDARLEALADRGNGNYAFIDDVAEAEKVLGEELEATTTVAAHDVKIQVELDPDVVRSYRLVGYDDRRLADEDFANDRVDAGDLGAGHSVTAIYELEPRSDAGSRAPLRVKVRYKASRTSASELLTHEVAARPVSFASASRDTRFAVAVTAFGGFVRGYAGLESLNLADVERWAGGAASGPGASYRREFVDLVSRMRELTAQGAASGGAPYRDPYGDEPYRPEPRREGCDPPFFTDPVTGVRKIKPHCM